MNNHFLLFNTTLCFRRIWMLIKINDLIKMSWEISTNFTKNIIILIAPFLTIGRNNAKESKSL